jgi:hypothetical protein
MPRSGGTLLYQLTKEIAETSGICEGKGFPKRRYRDGVVKTDTCESWMIRRVRSNKAIAFGTYRDFRDIVVSLRTFYNRRDRVKRVGKAWTVKDVLEYRSTILENYYCWQPYATWFRYEDENLALNIVEKVSDFLNVSLSFAEKQAIINRFSLTSNEERIGNQKVWMDAGGGSMLTKVHISPTRGKSTWQEVLSQEDLDKIMIVGEEWLKEHNYNE